MDWIDEEKRRRDSGIVRSLGQNDHAAVNARYPGCTLERCCECDDPTGRAGRGDDSLYSEDDKGPFCWECWSALTPDQSGDAREIDDGLMHDRVHKDVGRTRVARTVRSKRGKGGS